jgi:hypothetical protein
MSIWFQSKALIGWPLIAQPLNETRPKSETGTMPLLLDGASAMTSAEASAGGMLISCPVE